MPCLIAPTKNKTNCPARLLKGLNTLAMSSVHKNLSAYDETTIPSGSKMSFGIVVSEWNAEITHALYEACVETLHKHGVNADNIHIAQVPGAFELPMGARILLQHKKLDAVICLGCVIKGDTSHDEYINQAVATGLTNLSLTASKPCIFGLLTVNNLEQAQDRAGGKHGNKGTEAAVTAIRMADLARSQQSSKPTVGFDLRM